jgi:AraC-like DNA-binding protein
MSLSPPHLQSRWLGADFWRQSEWLSGQQEPQITAFLLLSGHLRLGWPERPIHDLTSGSLVWMNLQAVRPDWIQPIGHETPEVLMLSYPLPWVQSCLHPLRQEIAADLVELLLAASSSAAIISRPLEAEDRHWARSLMASTLCQEARKLLEGSRMSEFFFRKILSETREETTSCTRTQRLAMERVRKVREALLRNLEQPPALEELAALCGCHPQYLSRSFSETAGTTISLYLRRLRIERAAELMASGRMNASEAALEVGYRSLSHFSQAFRAEKGLPPSEWLRAKIAPSD